MTNYYPTRAQIKATAAVLIIQAGTIFETNVKPGRVSPFQAGNQNDPPADPLLGIYIFEEKETSVSRGLTNPQFNQNLTLEFLGFLEMADQYELDTALDTAVEAIKNALLGSAIFPALFKNIDNISIGTRINTGSGSARFVGELKIQMDLEMDDFYQPEITQDLTKAAITIDAKNVFDKTGTYTPNFDYPVPPAPRTIGPDGRPEIGGLIDIPT